jgi:hypothetical protein
MNTMDDACGSSMNTMDDALVVASAWEADLAASRCLGSAMLPMFVWEDGAIGRSHECIRIGNMNARKHVLCTTRCNVVVVIMMMMCRANCGRYSVLCSKTNTHLCDTASDRGGAVYMNHETDGVAESCCSRGGLWCSRG